MILHLTTQSYMNRTLLPTASSNSSLFPPASLHAGIDAAYARLLTAIRSLIDCCIPTRIVTIGPRDPEFVTPFIKHLLVKRRRLRRCGRINKANAIATKINELIVAHRSKRLASLLEATTKELWASVKNKKSERQPIKINGKLADPEEFNSFFSAISTNSDYT